MNERIRELAEQAAFRQFTMPKTNGDSALESYNGIFTEKEAIEKFAELLISESIVVMMKHDYHGEWLGEKLKEHFGIE